MEQKKENPAYITEQLITYIGNKRALLDFIAQGVTYVQKKLGTKTLSMADVFSGSGIVARFFRQYAHSLWTNDLELYSLLINQCYQANQSEINLGQLQDIYRELIHKVESQSPVPGFISELYAPKSDTHIQKGERCFYTRQNALYIDTVRKYIAEDIPSSLQPFFIAPLLSQASIHANTAGVFKGFYKNKEGIGQFGGTGKNALERITGAIQLPFPVFSNFECQHYHLQKEATAMAENIPEIDVAYLDPPYNQHPYGSNYFMLNVIVSGTPPDSNRISTVSGIPQNWNRSDYNKSRTILPTFSALVEKLPAKFLLISYSSEGFISPNQMHTLLEKYGKIKRLEYQYNAFRGSRNLSQRNKYVTEYLYIVEKN